MEPNLQCTAALLRPPPASSTATPTCWRCRATPRPAARCSPSTARSSRAASTDGGIELEVGGAEPMKLRCRLVVNSAGLHAPTLARKIDGHAIRPRADRVLRQRKLFHLGRPLALLAPDLSRPGAGRARRAHHRRSRRPGEVRPRRRMDPTASTTRSIRTAPTSSMPPCANTGRPSRTARCSRAMPASGPRSCRRARRRRTSPSRARPSTACPGLINLFGIESPGLTASLALAEQVRDTRRASMTAWPGAASSPASRALLGGCSPAALLNATVSRKRLHARDRHRLRRRCPARSSISTGPTRRAPTASR